MFRWFEKRLDPFPREAATTPPATLIAFCMHYTKGAWPAVLGASLLSFIIGIGEVYVYSFLGQIVDWLVSADRETFLEENTSRIAWMVFLMLVALPAAVVLQTLIVHQTLLGNYPMRIRWLAHRYLLGQSQSFFADEFAGRVATKMMQTALAVRESVLKLFDVLVYVIAFFVGTLAVAASADIRLLIPMLVWLAIYIAILWYFVPRLRDVAQAQADARSDMTGRVVDSYTNITTVKLFAHAGREEAYAREAMDPFLETVYQQMRLSSLFNICLYGLNMLLLFALGAMSVWFWLTGTISVGAIAVAVGLALRLNGISQWIMWEMSMLFENIGTVYDGVEMLSKPRAVQDKPDAPALEVKRGEINFDGIRFHYGKQGGVIEGLDLTIPAGQKVGLIGRSGAGKTTLVNLLLRLHDLEGGLIRIDGQDIASVRQETLRAHIGVVTQDTALLHRSVRENIAYGRPDASDTEIHRALELARATDFVDDLEDMRGRKGLDAHVGERGVKLSGGQRQRIAIARVLLKNAPLLALDEATSALDTEVEAAIQDSLYNLMAGKTVIAIAHRLSTIAAMDRLIVMDHGKIIEDGTHETLLKAEGLYSQLWKRQSGGFLMDTRPQIDAAE
ncbi:MAG: ABC transporter ATP-binding protein [Devosiaceae bacterium]|nr:ABC transporter ATP-binding protein [Devosiaceae bacterium MH13]